MRVGVDEYCECCDRLGRGGIGRERRSRGLFLSVLPAGGPGVEESGSVVRHLLLGEGVEAEVVEIERGAHGRVGHRHCGIGRVGAGRGVGNVRVVFVGRHRFLLSRTAEEEASPRTRYLQSRSETRLPRRAWYLQSSIRLLQSSL